MLSTVELEHSHKLILCPSNPFHRNGHTSFTVHCRIFFTLQYALLAALLYIYAILLPAAGCVALDDLWWKAGKANRALHISLFVSIAALAGGPVRLNHRPVKALGAEWTLYEGGGGGAPHPPPFLSPPAVAGTHSRTLTLSLFPSSSAAAACLCRSLVAVFVPLCCGWRRRFCPGRRGSTTRRGRGSAAGCLARPVRPAPGEEPPGWPTFPLGVVLKEEWTGGPFDC